MSKTKGNGKVPKGQPLATLPRALQGYKTRQWSDPSAFDAWPFLTELLRPVRDADGKITWDGVRISLRVVQGDLVLAITSATSHLQAEMRIAAMASVWDEVEKALTSDEMKWQPTFDVVKEEKQHVGKLVTKMT